MMHFAEACLLTVVEYVLSYVLAWGDVDVPTNPKRELVS